MRLITLVTPFESWSFYSRKGKLVMFFYMLILCLF